MGVLSFLRNARLIALSLALFGAVALVAASSSTAQPPLQGSTLAAGKAVRHLHERMLRKRGEACAARSVRRAAANSSSAARGSPTSPTTSPRRGP